MIDPNCHSTTSIPNWPKGADTHKATPKQSTELQNAASLISQAVNASSNILNNTLVAPTLNSSASGSNNNLEGKVIESNTDMMELNGKMNQLIGMINRIKIFQIKIFLLFLLELVKIQSTQINHLQAEVSSMRKANPMTSTKSMSEFSFKLEMQLSKLMEQYLKRYENEHKKKLTAFMAGRFVKYYVWYLNLTLITT